MENESFIDGNLGTQFIDVETTLMEDMKRIAEEAPPLQDKLPHSLLEKKKIAAITAAVALEISDSRFQGSD
jgi:pyruvate carboxylase subunit A